MRVGFLHFIGQHRVDHYLACRFYYAYCQIQLLFPLLMDCVYSADCMTRKVCISRITCYSIYCVIRLTDSGQVSRFNVDIARLANIPPL